MKNQQQVPLELICVRTTVAHLPEAQTIAQAVVSAKLAACVHIAAVTSVFFWQGVMQEQQEWLLEIKTCARHYEGVERVIKQLHSYDLPAIDALAVAKAEPAYAAWVADNCVGIV